MVGLIEGEEKLLEFVSHRYKFSQLVFFFRLYKNKKIVVTNKRIISSTEILGRESLKISDSHWFEKKDYDAQGKVNSTLILDASCAADDHGPYIELKEQMLPKATVRIYTDKNHEILSLIKRI